MGTQEEWAKAEKSKRVFTEEEHDPTMSRAVGRFKIALLASNSVIESSINYTLLDGMDAGDYLRSVVEGAKIILTEDQQLKGGSR